MVSRRALVPAVQLVAVALTLACGNSSTRNDAAVIDAGADGAEAGASLLELCLPTCITSLYEGCLPEGACVSETNGAVTTACFASGVKARREERADGTIETTTFDRMGRACLRKIQDDKELTYERLSDGRRARVHAVSNDLRTAFCGDDSYARVYPMPLCNALEQFACTAGRCAAP
jgi:hypothetical protein